MVELCVTLMFIKPPYKSSKSLPSVDGCHNISTNLLIINVYSTPSILIKENEHIEVLRR